MNNMLNKTEYELMTILHSDPSMACPDGIDSEPETLGDAIGVIRHLLKNDPSVKGYKLIKRQKR